MALQFEEGNYETTVAAGVATLKYDDEALFTSSTDLTKAEMKRVFDHADTYITGVTEEAARKATEIMKGDKSVDKVVIQYPYGMSKRGSVNTIAKRSETFKKPGTEDTVTKSTLRVAVKDPLTKMSKSVITSHEKAMTKALLG